MQAHNEMDAHQIATIMAPCIAWLPPPKAAKVRVVEHSLLDHSKRMRCLMMAVVCPSLALETSSLLLVSI